MTLRMVRVSLKDLWKSSNINSLQAASKAFIHPIISVIIRFVKEEGRRLFYIGTLSFTFCHCAALSLSRLEKIQL